MPVEMELFCPRCQKQHFDEGEWRTIEHKTHLCQHCGHKWRPFEYPTVGVLISPNTAACALLFERFYKKIFNAKDLNQFEEGVLDTIRPVLFDYFRTSYIKRRQR